MTSYVLRTGPNAFTTSEVWIAPHSFWTSERRAREMH